MFSLHTWRHKLQTFQQSVRDWKRKKKIHLTFSLSVPSSSLSQRFTAREFEQSLILPSRKKKKISKCSAALEKKRSKKQWTNLMPGWQRNSVCLLWCQNRAFKFSFKLSKCLEVDVKQPELQMKCHSLKRKHPRLRSSRQELSLIKPAGFCFEFFNVASEE